MSTHFIPSTTFITSSSFASHFLTLSNRSTSFIIISTILILFASNYSFFTNVYFSLSFSTPTSQSGLLLNLFAFPILLCHKLHLTITPWILTWFPQSKMYLKALKKIFWTMLKTCQSGQYSPRYQLISTGHWLVDIFRTAKHGHLLPYAHGSSFQYTSDDYK